MAHQGHPNPEMTLNANRRVPADRRGERLRPPKNSRVYWILTQLRRSYEALIKRHISAGKALVVVDYGCGNMPYKSLFPAARYLGADFAGNKLADITLAEGGELPLPNGGCDVVVSSQVLEHVGDVGLYLAESRRVLRDGGLLFLSTHGIWQYHPDPFDYWRWTCNGLQKIVTEAGFNVIEFEGILGAEAAALQLWQDAVSSRVPKWLQPAFFMFLQRRIRLADLRIANEVRDRDACVYVLVARRAD